MSSRCAISGRLLVTHALFGLLACAGPSDNSGKPNLNEFESTTRAHSVETQLVGQWKLDEGNGATANDTSGYNHTALIEGGGTYGWVPGKVGSTALQIGGGRYLRVEPTNALNGITGGVSMSGWFFRPTLPAGDEYLFYRRNQSAGTVFHLLQGASGTVCFSIATDQVCTNPVGVGAWHHFAATWDGQFKRIYIDGILAAQKAAVATLQFSSDYSLHIGSNQGGSLAWNGRIDDIRLHSRAINETEIHELFTQEPISTHPAGHALFVVGETTLSPSDAAIKAKLDRMGFDVVVVDDTVSSASNAVGKQLVFVSESCQSVEVNSKFKNVAVPVVIAEVAAWDDMALTGGAWAHDIGDSTSETRLNVVQGTVFSSGFSGSTSVALAATKFVWGVPGSQAVVGATLNGNISRATIFGYNAGAALPGGGTAQSRRVAIFPGKDTPAYLKDAGWSLMESAIRWAAATPVRLVVGKLPLSEQDFIIKSLLVQMGLSVSERVADATTPALASDANGMKGIVVSESVSSGNVLAAYRDVGIPVVSMEPSIADDMNLTGTTWQLDYGDVSGQTELDILSPADPMAAGLQGRISATTAPEKFVWGLPSSDARRIASIAGDISRVAIFAYTRGAMMVGLAAPANRVFFYMGSTAATKVALTSWPLFYAAVRDSLGTSSPTFRAYPGDACRIANANGTFDAVFTYHNPSGSNIEVPIGGGANSFSPAPMDRGQPTWFASGTNAFRITGLTETTKWALGGEVKSVSSSTPLCSTTTNADSELIVQTSTGVRINAGLDEKTVLSAGVVPTENIAGTAVGNSVGGLSIGDSGVAQYSIPLKTPPGHHTPNLGLVYSHTGGNGILGVGWTLAGLSQIRRCPQGKPYEERPAPVSYLESDTASPLYALCFNGRRLRPVFNAGIWPKVDRYTIDGDPRTLIRVTSFDGRGPLLVLVEPGDGSELTFGGTYDSLVEGPLQGGGTGRLAWSLTRSRDVYGNAFSVSYSKNVRESDGGVEHLPEEISYIRENPQLPPLRRIKFIYEPRPDEIEAYVAGLKTISTKRLSRIEMVAPNPEVAGKIREYRLSYRDGASITGRSLLRDVRECDIAGICKSPVEFAYDPGSFAFQAVNAPLLTNNASDADFVLPLDANGDGRDDFLYRARRPDGSIYWILAQYSGGAMSSTAVSGLPAGTRAGTPVNPTRADLDQDGRDEVGIYDEASDAFVFFRAQNASPSLFYIVETRLSSYSGDTSGDGLPDFAQKLSDGKWTYALSRPGGFDRPDDQIPGLNPVNSYYADVDGDSNLELLFVRTGSTKYEALNVFSSNPFVERHALTDLEPPTFTLPGGLRVPIPPDAPNGYRYLFFDFNGDGLSDNALIPNSTNSFFMRTNTGKGHRVWLSPNVPPEMQPALVGGKIIDQGIRVADVDLDGRQDVIVLPAGVASDPFWMKFANDGTAAAFPLLGIPRGAAHPWGATKNQVFDANGDGLTDIIVWENAKLSVLIRESRRPDLLVKITGSLGAVSELTYLPASNAEVHTPGFDPQGCTYPSRCVRDSNWLVRKVRTDDGIGGKREFLHAYRGLRASRIYGDLGAESHSVLDSATGNLTTTEMDNTTAIPEEWFSSRYAFAGLPKTVTVTTPIMNNGKAVVLKAASEYQDFDDSDQVLIRLSSRCSDRFETATPSSPPGNLQRVSRICVGYDYDTFGNQTLATTWTGRNDRVIQQFEVENWSTPRVLGVIKKATYQGIAFADGPLGYRNVITEREYVPDSRGRVRQEIVEPNGNSDQRLIRTYDRNSRGQIVGIVEVGRVTAELPNNLGVEHEEQTRRRTFQYDRLDGVFLASADDNGHRRQFMYHAGLGVLMGVTDQNNVPSQFRYDGFGRFRRGQRAGEGEESVSYSKTADSPYRISSVQRGGPTTTTEFDILARPVREVRSAFRGKEIEQLRQYDSAGRLAKSSTPHFTGSGPPQFQTLEYDALGRPYKYTAPDGVETTRRYDGLSTAHIDANGNEILSVTNEQGQVISTVEGGLETRIYYGPFGRTDRVVQPGGHVLSVGYDSLGRRTEMDDPNSGHHVFANNAFAELVHHIDGSGAVESTAFDHFGRPVASMNPDGITSFEYDDSPFGIGNIGTARSSSGVIDTFTYDNRGRQISQTMTIQGSDPIRVDQGFDSFGRLANITYPDAGRQDPLTIGYRYSAHGAGELLDIINVKSGVRLWQAEDRDAFGQVAQELYGNGIRTARSHDELGQLRRLESAFVGVPETVFDALVENPSSPIGSLGEGERIQNLRFGYDANRDLNFRGDNIQGNIERYTYDSLRRLKTWSLSGTSITPTAFDYGYDSSTNLKERITTAGVTPNASYVSGIGAGPHAISSGPVGSYGYNSNGNQTVGPDRSVEYTYFGLPKRISSSSSRSDFLYDAFGARVKKSTGATSTIYGPSGLYERRSGSSAIQHVFHIRGLGRRIAQVVWNEVGGTIADSSTEYLHTDSLDSVEAVSDSQGNLIGRLRFDPFGKRTDPTRPWQPVASTSPFPGNVRHGFTGHEHDLETDLVNANGRIYDANASRFLTPDPLVQAPLSGKSYNRYSYAFNSPTNFVDPTGFFNTGSWIGGGTAPPVDLGGGGSGDGGCDGICISGGMGGGSGGSYSGEIIIGAALVAGSVGYGAYMAWPYIQDGISSLASLGGGSSDDNGTTSTALGGTSKGGQPQTQGPSGWPAPPDALVDSSTGQPIYLAAGPKGYIIKLLSNGGEMITKKLFGKAEAVAARKAGHSVRMSTEQSAKAVEIAAHGGGDNLIRHSPGHLLETGKRGGRHYQTDGVVGHSFWTAASAFISGMLDPFDLITGDLGADDETPYISPTSGCGIDQSCL